MNTIHEYIRNDVKIACYADDIAIWHTDYDIKVSETALNDILAGIQSWAKGLKLTINPDKSNSCVFTTDRRNRKNFQPVLKMHNTAIKQVSHPKYLGVILDAELRFTKHIDTTFNRALKKINILRKLCGSTWGTRTQTLLNTYTMVIRPTLEYAAPIWVAAPSAPKVDAVQYRAAKIIIGAVSSTNNLKAEMECDLVPLENRRRLAMVKFTNKIRSSEEDHISKITYNKWTAKERLSRSSTLQLDKNVREKINLQHTCLDITQEPTFPIRPPRAVQINLNLLQPCTKKEPQEVIKRKGLETIKTFSTSEAVTVYTDGSSDSNCNRGGAGIFLIHPDGSSSKHRFAVGEIASNFTSELVAIREALNICNTSSDCFSSIIIFSDCKSALEAIQEGKTKLTQEINNILKVIMEKKISCVLQWIPAHVDIEGNEQADVLAKEARTLDPTPPSTTLADANAVAKRKLTARPRCKFPTSSLNCTRDITTTIARLRTGHIKGLKILPDGSRQYSAECPHCPGQQLEPEHLLNCPAIGSALFRIDINWTRDIIYTEKVVEVAKAVLHTFGPI